MSIGFLITVSATYAMSSGPCWPGGIDGDGLDPSSAGTVASESGVVRGVFLNFKCLWCALPSLFPALLATAGMGFCGFGRTGLWGRMVRSAAPMAQPTRGHLDSIEQLMVGDLYVEGGSRQRNIPKSLWCDPFKVSEHVSKFEARLQANQDLNEALWQLSGASLRVKSVTLMSFAWCSETSSQMPTTETKKRQSHRQRRYLTTWRSSEKYPWTGYGPLGECRLLSEWALRPL